jgi:hypothetical protein
LLALVSRSRPKTTRGNASKLLESRILQIQKKYAILTVRQFYYIMISRFGYHPGRPFYKRFVYHLSKVRQNHEGLHAKIIDHTREFIPAPIGFHKVELWVEKDAIRMVSEDLASKYRVSIQVLRGFPSITMLRKALSRARKRGVRKILYIGDYDPSGVLIEQVASREMQGIEFQRLAITPEQAQRHRLPSIKVNRRDSRANKYIKKNGDKAWELESLKPRIFHQILEKALKTNIPNDFLRRARNREKAIKIAKPFITQFSKKIEQEIIHMFKAKKV